VLHAPGAVAAPRRAAASAPPTPPHLPLLQHAGYFVGTNFLNEVDRTGETVFYDSVSGKPLFVAPRGRTFAEFEKESRSHGWPSFRDSEVIWDDVRVLRDGEAVSLAGTHLVRARGSW
jgi:hypothetical protein